MPKDFMPRIEGNTAYIELTQRNGLIHTLIMDTEDLPKLVGCTICPYKSGKTFYVQVRIGSTFQCQLHRLILGVLDSPDLVDHGNRNGLDNRKENLTLTNKSGNAFNTGLPSTNTSGIKGVYFNKARNKWQAQVKLNQVVYLLGLYTNITEAETRVKEFRVEHNITY